VTAPRQFAPDRPAARSRGLIIGAIILVVAAVTAGLVMWFTRKPPVTADSPAAAPSSAARGADPEAEDHLLHMLPQGYASDACKLADPPTDALAEVTCDANDDANGPRSATYTSFRNQDALAEAFKQFVNSADIQTCPGNVQSPGPWRRSGAPNDVIGTLFCGSRGTDPVVAWTTDSELLLGSVVGRARGPNLAQLYTWWSSHS
jgi:hypothetical protein